MKKQLWATAAAVVVALAAPAIATAGEGVIDLSYYNSDDIDVDAINVGGAVVTEVGQLNLQLDADFSRFDLGGADVTFSSGSAHLFHRTDSYAFGGFYNITSFAGDGVHTVGLEGAKYWDRLTLSGLVSTSSDDFDGFEDLTTVGADLNYFINDNFSIGAGYTNYSGDASLEDDAYGVHAEWKTMRSISFFGSYQKFDEADVDNFTIGIRHSFGGGTLKERDRSGPSMTRGSSILRALF
jgi:hypothetical protein